MLDQSLLKVAENWVKERYLKSDLMLPYHNWAHVTDVYNAVLRLSQLENQSEEKRNLLIIAVLFHDIGLLYTEDDHEEYSCLIFNEFCKEYPQLSEDEQSIIKNLIMATRIPQTPQNEFEKVICDADLDNLHRDDFLDITAKVYQEKLFRGNIITWKEMLQETKDFLEEHSYCTEVYQNKFDLLKQANIKKLEGLIIAEK